MHNQFIVRARAIGQRLRMISSGRGFQLGRSGREERRSETRVEANNGAILQSLEFQGAPPIHARVVSTSERGLQLRTAFIFPRQLVQIWLGDRTVCGEVCYCAAYGDDFNVGIRLL